MNMDIHEAVGLMLKAMGIPTSPTSIVTCVDCGAEVIVAGCTWWVGEGKEHDTGPHCGCKKRKENE